MWGTLVHEELNRCKENLPRVEQIFWGEPQVLWDSFSKECVNTDTWTSDFTKMVHGYYTFGYTVRKEVIRDPSIWKKKYEEEALTRFIIPLDNAYEELFGYKFSDKVTYKNMKANMWMVNHIYTSLTEPLFYKSWCEADWPDE